MVFDKSPSQTKDKLNSFPKYVRRQSIARFIAQYEIFKRQINVKGSIVECGVHHGGGVMAWAKISSTLEPYNYHRKIIGFDTFEGFPSVNELDISKENNAKVGFLAENYNILEELSDVVQEYNDNRFINHIEKIELIKGDANKTIPEYVNNNKHLLVSLLYLDFDLYEPTLTALKNIVPKMPKGAIIAFDELNNWEWPGETLAFLEQLKINQSKLECFEFEPNISFIQL